MWPDKTLMKNSFLSSITTIAGSVFLSLICGAINLITAPNENRQISASFILKSSEIFCEAGSEYHLTSLFSLENFFGA